MKAERDLFDKAFREYSKGDPGYALEVLKQAMGDPKLTETRRLDCHYLEADILLDRKLYKKAVIAYTKILKMEKCDVAYANRALSYWEGGQYTRALRDYQRAVKLNPANHIACCCMARLLLRKKEYNRAAFYFRRALRKDSKYISALLGLARVHAKLNRFVKSYEMLSRVILIEPTNDEAVKGLRSIEKMFDM